MRYTAYCRSLFNRGWEAAVVPLVSGMRQQSAASLCCFAHCVTGCPHSPPTAFTCPKPLSTRPF